MWLHHKSAKNSCLDSNSYGCTNFYMATSIVTLQLLKLYLIVAMSNDAFPIFYYSRRFLEICPNTVKVAKNHPPN